MMNDYKSSAINETIGAIYGLTTLFKETSYANRSAMLNQVGHINWTRICDEVNTINPELAEILKKTHGLGTYLLMQELKDGKLGSLGKPTSEELKAVRLNFPRVKSEEALKLIYNYMAGWPLIQRLYPTANEPKFMTLLVSGAISNVLPEVPEAYDFDIIKANKELKEELSPDKGERFELPANVLPANIQIENPGLEQLIQ